MTAPGTRRRDCSAGGTRAIGRVWRTRSPRPSRKYPLVKPARSKAPYGAMPRKRIHECRRVNPLREPECACYCC